LCQSAGGTSNVVVSILSNPFEHLQKPPGAGFFVHVRTETDLEQAERKRRDDYINWVKKRYLSWDLDRVVETLKKSIVQQAVIETSAGRVERDPVCVITRPLYDEATCVAYAHTDEVINVLRERVAVIDLGLEHANRRNVETVLQDLRPIYYKHCGHGTEDALLGQDDERMLDDSNVHFLAGCTVSTIACHSSRLAKLAVERGCIAFFGYRTTFEVLTDISVARLRFQILSGIERPLKAEDLWSTEKFVSEAIKSALIHDRDNCFLLGDPEARVMSLGKLDRERYHAVATS